MAIYSLNLGFISRSKGRSSVAFSAYISGSQHKEEQSGKTYSYLHREDIAISRILAPENAPAWVLDPAIFWNKVEQFEDEIITQRFQGNAKNSEKNQKSLAYRDHLLKTARTAQTIMGALPLELARGQAKSCVEEFLKTRFVSRGLVVHYAIHWDEGNPHFHGLITRRALAENTFASRKDEDIVSPPEHRKTRKQWEVIVNKHLALSGSEVRIDCRSNKERGLIFKASKHEGYYAQRLGERGEKSRILTFNEETRQHNIQLLCDHPEVLIHEISQKRIVFTRTHIEEEIIRRVGGDEELFAILKACVEGIKNPNDYAPNENFAGNLKNVASKLTDSILKNSEITQFVGQNIQTEPIFTSTTYKKQEEKLTNLADTLNRRFSKDIPSNFVTEILNKENFKLGFSFSEEQAAAIHYLCSGSDIRILNGRAGTGKTTLLKVVAEVYQASGFNVFGTSFQGKAVEIMECEIGIPCRTLDSLNLSWENHERQNTLVKNGKLWGQAYLSAFQKMKELELQRFHSKDVILVDEANMIGGTLWESFLAEAVNKGAKVLIIQDTEQIKSREPGDYGRLFAERFGSCETRKVHRQKITWQKECTVLLNKGHVLDGLAPYQQKGYFQWHDTTFATHEAMVDAYLKDFQENSNQNRIALAYRNHDVNALNQQIRLKLKEQEALRSPFRIGNQEFSIGDRIRFTQNDHQGHFVKNIHANLFQTVREHLKPMQIQGVKNGTFGTILARNNQHIKVQLDDGRYVKFKSSEYTHLTYGYALSIHKSEGSTFDRTFVALDPLLNASTLLVAMTRHRHDVQAFINREEIIDFKALVEKINRGKFKETLYDYKVPEDKKIYLECVQKYANLLKQSTDVREKIGNSLKPNTSFWKHPESKHYKDLLDQKKGIASEILFHWKKHLPYVRLAGIRKDTLEIEVGFRQRILSDLEQRASIQAQGYMDLVRETQYLWKTILETYSPVLAKNHPLYPTYKKLTEERNSLAAVFVENLNLYRPFLKITEDKEGQYKDYWNNFIEAKDRFMVLSLKKYAAAHIDSQHQKAFEDRLSLEHKEFYKNIKYYKEASFEAAALYKLCKDQTNAFCLTPEMLKHSFQETCVRRDASALQIVRNYEAYQLFLEQFKIQESKLLTHATFGEIREKARTYTSEQDPFIKASYAQEMVHLLKNLKEPRITILLKQEGIDLQKIRFDIVYAEKIKKEEIPSQENPEYIFNHIQNYQKASREVGRAWKLNIHAQKPQSWEEALKIRQEAAQCLIHCDTAFKIFKDMHPQRIENLKSHAQEINPIPLQNFKPFYKVEHVLNASRGRIQEIADNLLGTHNYHLSTKSTLRFGSNGKIVVHIQGGKEGLWYDFAESIGGNIFQFIQHYKGLSFREAVDYCAWFLGVRAEERFLKTKIFSTQMQKKQDEHDKYRRLTSVAELYQKSQSTQGTIAEIYLRKERCIQCDLSNDLRYVPKGTRFIYSNREKILTHDSLAAFGRNSLGELSSVQLTKLNNDGTRACNKEGKKLNKIQYGVAKGSFVTLQSDPQRKQVFIAEGIETALSIKEAGVKGAIVASMGIYNMKNYQGPETKIIICSDNDGKLAHTNEAIHRTQEYFESQRKSAIILKPNREGQDFNDILKESGIKSIQKYLSDALVSNNKPSKNQSFYNR